MGVEGYLARCIKPAYKVKGIDCAEARVRQGPVLKAGHVGPSEINVHETHRTYNRQSGLNCLLLFTYGIERENQRQTDYIARHKTAHLGDRAAHAKHDTRMNLSWLSCIPYRV